MIGKNAGGSGGNGLKSTNKDDPEDLSSCSEAENPEDTNEETDEPSPYYCRHCFAASSKDWRHVGKERLLVCSDCRDHYKRYAEFPALDGEIRRRELLEKEKEELALKAEQEQQQKRQQQQQQQQQQEEASLAVKKDEPVEIKAEAPIPGKVPGLFSPVPSIPSTSGAGFLSPHHIQQQMPSPSGSNEVQCLGERRPAMLGLSPLPLIGREQQQQQQQQQQQVVDDPPPKPDGSECHRSQSAIFTRMWNRGEGNSCSRTDMIFKPVPDSKLARKRDERLRKAAEREEVFKAQEAAAKRQHQILHDPLNPLFSPDPFRMMHHRGFPPGHPLAAGGEHPAAPQPPPPQPPPPQQPQQPRHHYPPGFAPAPPPPASTRAPNPGPSVHHPPPGAAQFEMERRRLEEIRSNAERQMFADRMNAALATDPLVRLQMAGVTPEIPPGTFGLPHPPPPPSAPPPGLPRPPHGLDPRYRSPEDFLRPGLFGSPDLLQRQLMIEREHSLMAQRAAQHTLLAQQEEFLRQIRQ